MSAMSSRLPGDVDAVRCGADRLASELWGELRKIATRERYRVGAGETLRATALVSEAWLRLRRRDDWSNDEHFLRSAALAMRHVLVDHARARLAAKRGSGKLDPLTDDLQPFWESDDRLVELDEALGRLAKLNPRLAQVVELRFFAGYSDEQTARLLGMTDRTVRRDWVKARAWLFRELNGELVVPLPLSEERIAS
jgi:RNA polymerase sigma factor (TIGR02999 family)